MNNRIDWNKKQQRKPTKARRAQRIVVSQKYHIAQKLSETSQISIITVHSEQEIGNGSEMPD
jgi:hypothetical protein